MRNDRFENFNRQRDIALEQAWIHFKSLSK